MHVRMTTMTSSVERINLDFKISVALTHIIGEQKYKYEQQEQVTDLPSK